MSTSETPNSTASSSSATTTSSPLIRPRKVLVPKVWKRPHSTIYGKNVEFGSSLYSDKLGEINGRKFNSELPWTMRNSGGGSSSSSGSQYNQGYLSNLLLPNEAYSAHKNTLHSDGTNPYGGNACGSSYRGVGNDYNCNNYADLLELTNPARFSKRHPHQGAGMGGSFGSGGCGSGGVGVGGNSSGRIDFYEKYSDDFSKEIERLNRNSLMLNEPLLTRKVFDNFLDFDHEIGVFLPSSSSSSIGNNTSNFTNSYGYGCGSSCSDNDNRASKCHKQHEFCQHDINHTKSFVPSSTTTQTHTNVLPKHTCQLRSSPYGQSTDGRKLSLGSINPSSYRPSLPQRTTTAHASDGEEFEFQDRSSPFYTDR